MYDRQTDAIVNNPPNVRFSSSDASSPNSGNAFDLHRDRDAVVDRDVGDGLDQRHPARLFGTRYRQRQSPSFLEPLTAGELPAPGRRSLH
jgi:hypothetical protein